MSGASSVEDTIRCLAAVLVEIPEKKKRSELRLADGRGCRAMLSARVHFGVMGKEWGGVQREHR